MALGEQVVGGQQNKSWNHFGEVAALGMGVGCSPGVGYGVVWWVLGWLQRGVLNVLMEKKPTGVL